LKKLIFSEHAIERLKERNISESEVRVVLDDPDISILTRRQRRKRVMKALNNRTLDIIYEERPNYIYIVTCAILRREGKNAN